MPSGHGGRVTRPVPEGSYSCRVEATVLSIGLSDLVSGRSEECAGLSLFQTKGLEKVTCKHYNIMCVQLTIIIIQPNVPN